jgi:hypothetical protein
VLVETKRDLVDNSINQSSPIKGNITVARNRIEILHDNSSQQAFWSAQITDRNLAPMILPLILPSGIKTFHKLFPGRRSNRIRIERAETKVKRNAGDFC